MHMLQQIHMVIECPKNNMGYTGVVVTVTETAHEAKHGLLFQHRAISMLFQVNSKSTLEQHVHQAACVVIVYLCMLIFWEMSLQLYLFVCGINALLYCSELIKHKSKVCAALRQAKQVNTTEYIVSHQIGYVNTADGGGQNAIKQMKPRHYISL